jgi:VWFA-related protein
MKKIALIWILIFTVQLSAQDNKVTMSFSVLNETKIFLTGLKSSDIQILQGKDNLQIVSFEEVKSESLDVVIMIDASASQERTLPKEKEFAQKFVEYVLDVSKDAVAIVKFTGEPLLMQDFTNDVQKAVLGINRIQFEPPKGYVGSGVVIGSSTVNSKKQTISGSTSIWDSILKVSEGLSKSTNKKIVLLISDGVNTYGEKKQKDIIESLIKQNIAIYSIGIGDEEMSGIDKKSLSKISNETGGKVFITKKDKDASEAISQLKHLVQMSYKVSFMASPKNEIQDFEIKIVNSEVNKQNPEVIKQKGFFLSK